MSDLSDKLKEQHKCTVDELENEKFEYVQFLKPPYLESRNMVVGNPALRCAVQEKSIVLWYVRYSINNICDASEWAYEYHYSQPIIDYSKYPNPHCGITVDKFILPGEIKQINELVLINFLSHNMSSVQQHSIDTLSDFPQILPYIEPKEYYIGTNVIESTILYNQDYYGGYFLNQNSSIAYNRTVNCVIKNNFNPLYFEPLQPEQRYTNEGWSGYIGLLLSYLEYCGKIWKTALYINGKRVGSFQGSESSGEPAINTTLIVNECNIQLDLRPSSGFTISSVTCKLNDDEYHSDNEMLPITTTIFYGPRRPSLDPFVFNFRICFNGIFAIPAFNLIADLVEEC